MPSRPSSIPNNIPSALPPRPGFTNAPDPSAVQASLDDLIGQAASEAAPVDRKEDKKKKSANIRLVFFDESVSPEEKMARLPRFAVAV